MGGTPRAAVLWLTWGCLVEHQPHSLHGPAFSRGVQEGVGLTGQC